MSSLVVPIYRTEAGVHTNPAVNGLFSTHCDDGGTDVKKTFREVFIYFQAGAWIISPVLVGPDPGPATIVALEVYNPCTDEYALINYPINDFRLRQLCCNNDPDCLSDPAPEGGFSGSAPFGSEVDEQFQILGSGPYTYLVTNGVLPPWAEIDFDPETGIIHLTGETGPGDEDVVLEIEVGNCGGTSATTLTFEVTGD